MGLMTESQGSVLGQRPDRRIAIGGQSWPSGDGRLGGGAETFDERSRHMTTAACRDPGLQYHTARTRGEKVMDHGDGGHIALRRIDSGERQRAAADCLNE